MVYLGSTVVDKLFVEVYIRHIFAYTDFNETHILRKTVSNVLVISISVHV